MPATVLLVDSDLGFVFWLGQALDVAGLNALPAADFCSALELIRELGVLVDMLVVNPALPGSPVFVSGLRRSRPGVIVICALRNDSGETVPFPDFDALGVKPPRLSQETRLAWVNLILGLAPA